MAVFCAAAWAQNNTGTLNGQIVDPTKAAVPGATVTLASPSHTQTATSSPEGKYHLVGVVPGTYKVSVSAEGFTTFEKDGVIIAAGPAQRLDVTLAIEMAQQNIEVTDQAAAVDTTSENNSNKIVISGDTLKSLSDDPDDLATDLQALAGLSVGPSSGQMYIDGFTGGQMPPKSSIRL